jgi:Ca2+-binding EF-hand superfamily protein
MGEHVSETEIDMMIAMIDLNGDGQVSFRAFKAMVDSPDPAKDDFEYLYLPKRGRGSKDLDINSMHNSMKEAFLRYIISHNITKADILRAWDSLRRSALPSKSFRLGRDQMFEVMSKLADPDIVNLLSGDTDEAVDGRELIMCFSSLLGLFSTEEKCKLAFDMFDVDGSGYLSIDQIEVILACSHFRKRDSLKKKAQTLLRLVGDTYGRVSKKALAAGTDKFPSLVFPYKN